MEGAEFGRFGLLFIIGGLSVTFLFIIIFFILSDKFKKENPRAHKWATRGMRVLLAIILLLLIRSCYFTAINAPEVVIPEDQIIWKVTPYVKPTLTCPTPIPGCEVECP